MNKNSELRLVLMDFEFSEKDGDRKVPILAVFREWPSGRTVRLRFDRQQDRLKPPFEDGPDVVHVAYMASAELGCYESLGWKSPTHVIDLFAEFCQLKTGVPLEYGRGLLGALRAYDLPGMLEAKKTAMHKLAANGGPFTEAETQELMDYCEEDVDALERLLPKILPAIPRMTDALIRGRFMAAAAKIEATGIPMDVELLECLKARMPTIKQTLIRQVDAQFGVYEGMTFRSDRWLAYCEREGIAWPLHPSGQPDLRRETFSKFSKIYPQIRPVHEVRTMMSQVGLEGLQVGKDGRCRTLLWPFSSKTSRNQPSGREFLFCRAKWERSLIKPMDGMSIAYIDWCSQEVGIAAALSGDENLMHVYLSGDPYLAFAKMAGAVPANGTKESHPAERAQYKQALLAVLMGMQAYSLGVRTKTNQATGHFLLNMVAKWFPKFWAWSQHQVDRAYMGERLETVYGWGLEVGPTSRPNTFRNFALQANGAEMMRLAAIAATECGISLCATVHDALLVEAKTSDIEEVVAQTRQLMAEASRAVLGGLELQTDVQLTSYPNRFVDKDGKAMWEKVTNLAGINP